MSPTSPALQVNSLSLSQWGSPPLISNCLNCPLEFSEGSGRLESCLLKMGDKKDTVPGSLTGPCSSFSSGQAIDYYSGPSKHLPIHLAWVVAADVFWN